MKYANILSICNAKGGCGKTATTINLGAGLAELGYQVLLIDFDPQKANLTTALGHQGATMRYTISTLLSTALDCPEELDSYLAKSILPIEKMHMIPANKKLASLCTRLSIEAACGHDEDMSFRPEQALSAVLEPLRSQFDYIIIDCGPKLDMLMTNAMVAANQIIIPVQAHFLAMEGLTDILETVAVIQKKFNPHLTIGGILLTMYQSKTNLCRNVEQQILELYSQSIHLFESPIISSIKVAENTVFGSSLFRNLGSHPATQAYAAMAKEVAYGKA